jgi:hypothetical protein
MSTIRAIAFLHEDVIDARAVPMPVELLRGAQPDRRADSGGAGPDREAVTPADLAATLLRRLGLDSAREIVDLTGRPDKLAEGRPIRAVFG